MKNILLFIVLISTSVASHCVALQAQSDNETSVLRGTIFRAHEDGSNAPLAGVNVRWLGTAIGAVSGPDGKFTLTREGETGILLLSYAGYEGRVEVTSDENDITVAMDFVASLPEVEVEENRSGISIDNADVRTTETISQQELLRCACCSLSESFQTSVSVDVAPVDAVTGARQIELLGLKGVYTQMNTENFAGVRGLAAPYGLEYIPGSWLENIQVSKGSGSVINGYESITGQINVELKKPWNSAPMYMNAIVNNTGRAEANLNAATTFSDRWSAMVLAHGNFYDANYDNNGDRFLDITRKAQVNVLNRWSFIDSTWDTHMGVNAIWDRRRGGQPDFGFGSARTASGLWGLEVQTRRIEGFSKGGVLLSHANNSSLAWLVTATHHEQDAFIGERDYDGRQQSLLGRFVYKFDLFSSDHGIALGTSVLLDDYEESLDTLQLARNERVPGIFGEYTYSGIKNFTAIAGVRADAHNLYGTFLTPRLHFRYQPDELVTLRVSGGKGSRSAYILAENYQALASARELVVDPNLRLERAWNYGLSVTAYISLFGKDMALDAEFYRTDFENQIVTDNDRDPRHIYFYNLDGRSYSNSFQTQVGFTLIQDLDMRAAYRWYDVRATYDGVLRKRALQSSHKGLITASWKPDSWQFDATLIYHGPGRIPSTASNPERYRVSETFDGYFQVLAQVSKKVGVVDLYLGAENLTGFIQETPIIAADDPFGPYFDASLVWGPIAGRIVYFGARLTVE